MADSLAMGLIVKEWLLQFCEICEPEQPDPGDHRVGTGKGKPIDA
jgi:hypothetical protein